MSIPLPGADEDATPIYGIRKPKSTRLAKWIWQSIGRIADDVESALSIFGLPPVVTGTPVVAASAGARDAHWGVPANSTESLALQAAGAMTIRTDKGWIEQYFALYNAGTNPTGASVAGWYPIGGYMPQFSVDASSAVSIASGAWAVLTGGWGTPKMNSGFTFASGVLTVPFTGRYDIVSRYGSATSAAVMRQGVQVTKNTATADTNPVAKNITSSRITVEDFSRGVELVAGDQLRVNVFQDSGGALNTLGTYETTLSVSYLGPRIGA